MFDRVLNTYLHSCIPHLASFLMHSYIRTYSNLTHCGYIINEAQNSQDTLYWLLWVTDCHQVKWHIICNELSNCSVLEYFRYIYILFEKTLFIRKPVLKLQNFKNLYLEMGFSTSLFFTSVLNRKISFEKLWKPFGNSFRLLLFPFNHQ